MVAMKEVVDNGWYEHLEEEIKQIVSVKWRESEEIKLEGRHQVGKTILHYKDTGIIKPYARDGSGLDQTLKKLGKAFGVGEREMYYCYEFADTYPDFDYYMSKQPMNIDWTATKKQLPSGSKEPIARKKRTAPHAELLEELRVLIEENNVLLREGNQERYYLPIYLLYGFINQHASNIEEVETGDGAGPLDVSLLHMRTTGDTVASRSDLRREAGTGEVGNTSSMSSVSRKSRDGAQESIYSDSAYEDAGNGVGEVSID